jgi:hypothetical protein
LTQSGHWPCTAVMSSAAADELRRYSKLAVSFDLKGVGHEM